MTVIYKNTFHTPQTIQHAQNSENNHKTFESYISQPIEKTTKSYIHSEYMLDTNYSTKSVNLNNMYGTETPSTTGIKNLEGADLLLPSAKNIKALSSHISQRFKDMMNHFNIPYAPKNITFDQAGNMVIPDNYPHKEELEKAIKQTPGLEREMRDVNALSSHFAAIQSLQPVHDEIEAAQSNWEVEQILKEYKAILDKASKGFDITLNFSSDGNMTVLADGKALNLLT